MERPDISYRGERTTVTVFITGQGDVMEQFESDVHAHIVTLGKHFENMLTL